MTDPGTKIVKVEWAQLLGSRPRPAGCNARLGEHGQTVRVPLARLTTAVGASGFGRAMLDPQEAARILGMPLDDLFTAGVGTHSDWLAFDCPLWDLAGKYSGKPVYALAAPEVTETPHVACYDTSLYFDDLHLESDSAAADLIAQEARWGHAQGHRSFKIKVGRGARHLSLQAGTARDIAVVHAVRSAVGPDARVLLDANNGYNLNLTKQVLQETATCRPFWIEEPFHEDPVLYADLKAWLQAQRLATLIADGEGDASPRLLEWAESGLIQVIQYDIFGYGFTRWLALGRRLDTWGVASAPHHYGGHLGNYVSAHLAPALKQFALVEWDEATTPGLDATAYAVTEGNVVIPNLPGFGLELEDERFARAVEESGFVAQ